MNQCKSTGALTCVVFAHNSGDESWPFCQVVRLGLSSVLVLEDDIRFEPFFRRKLGALMDELRTLRLQWDLV